MTDLWRPRFLDPRPDPIVPGETLPAMFWQAAQLRSSQVAMRQKRFGLWQGWTWREVGDIVRELSLGLGELGMRRGECASILANNAAEWVWFDLAILSLGGVVSGIYPTDAANQVEYLCRDSRSVILIVEDEEQMDKALAIRAGLPDLRRIVLIDEKGLKRFSDPMVLTLADLRRLGAERSAREPGEFDALREAVQPQDLAILVYTSGTTGRPKGAMHTHRGLMAATRGYNQALPQDERDQRMSFLPLCHIAERIAGLYASLYSGTLLNFVENPGTVAENVREIAPTLLGGVPRIWEKFYSAVSLSVKEAGFVQQAAYRWALSVGHEVAARVLERQAVGPWLKFKYRLAGIAALDHVRQFIGIHRARFLFTGAAPIAPDLIRWYLALGVPMLEGWGQTETGGFSTMMPVHGIRLGSIGKSCGGSEVKVDPSSGELMVRGPSNFVGYLNLPRETSETLTAEGWIRTGDVGDVDADGYFRITDRLKNIIITAGGKNITPSEWENELKFSPYVTDAVVIGDKRPYLTAIVMIEQENVEKYAQDRGVPFSNYASLTHAPEVRQLIQGEVDAINRKFARVEQIKNFFLLENQLSAEDEELTPTMKLKRVVIEKKYAEQIESMYR